MKSYSLMERATFYIKKFPNWPDSWPWVWTGRWLNGVWILGQNYRSKQKFYGAYPPNYVERITALFPDAKKVLHLFSGVLPPGSYTRFDINPELNPDVVGDAHNMPFPENSFDMIFSDSPYSEEDAQHYGHPLVNRKKVLEECYRILEPGGFVAWLDQVLPMYRKDKLQLVGQIGITRSTNHRFRVVSIYHKF